jgi:hypothetical protein
MAEIANDFVFARTGRPSLYPWDEWSDGQTRIVERFVDFHCAMDSFTNHVHTWARRHGFRARTQTVAVNRIAIRMEPTT